MSLDIITNFLHDYKELKNHLVDSSSDISDDELFKFLYKNKVLSLLINMLSSKSTNHNKCTTTDTSKLPIFSYDNAKQLHKDNYNNISTSFLDKSGKDDEMDEQNSDIDNLVRIYQLDTLSHENNDISVTDHNNDHNNDLIAVLDNLEKYDEMDKQNSDIDNSLRKYQLGVLSREY